MTGRYVPLPIPQNFAEWQAQRQELANRASLPADVEIVSAGVIRGGQLHWVGIETE